MYYSLNFRNICCVRYLVHIHHILALISTFVQDVDRDPWINPPIHIENFLSGGAMIFILIELRSIATISFLRRSAIPGIVINHYLCYCVVVNKLNLFFQKPRGILVSCQSHSHRLRKSSIDHLQML